MGFWEDLDLDKDDVIETLVLVLVLVLVVVVMVTLCRHMNRTMKARRKREELVEEAGSFFSFHQAMPSSVPQEPGRLTALYESTVYSLSGTRADFLGHPYTSMSQTPARDPSQQWVKVKDSAVLLDPGQHVSTPIHPPSYFSTATPPSVSEYGQLPAKPNTPPPPYLQ